MIGTGPIFYAPGEVYHGRFETYNSSGVLTNASSTPTALLWINGVATNFAPAVSNPGGVTGVYNVTIDPLEDVAIGDDGWVEITATVDGVTQKGCLPAFRIAFNDSISNMDGIAANERFEGTNQRINDIILRMTGMSSLPAWLRYIARSDLSEAVDPQTHEEINADIGNSVFGTYDPTTASAQAIRAAVGQANTKADTIISAITALPAAVWGFTTRTLTSLAGLLTGSTVTVQNIVDTSDGDRLNLVAGDDYTAAQRVPTWTITNWTGPALTPAGQLRVTPIATYLNATDNTVAPDLQVAAAVAVNGSTVTITAPIPEADSIELTGGTYKAGKDTHEYQLLGFTAGGGDVTIKLGPATVFRRITPKTP